MAGVVLGGYKVWAASDGNINWRLSMVVCFSYKEHLTNEVLMRFFFSYNARQQSLAH